MRVWLAGMAVVATAFGQGAGVQVFPEGIEFDDDNVGFSQTVGVVSAQPGVAADVAVEGGAWLSVTPRAITTPARLTVSATKPGNGQFTARIVIRSRSTGAATTLATIPVTGAFTPTRALFRAAPNDIAFRGQVGAAIPPQFIDLVEANCAQVKAVTSDPWISVAPTSAETSCSRLQVRAVTAGLGPGGLSGTIRLEFGAAGAGVGKLADITVSLFLTPAGPELAVNPEGVQFEAIAVHGNAQAKNIAVLNLGDGLIVWNARIVDPPGIRWLRLGATSGAVSRGIDSRIPLSIDTTGLRDGTHYALVEVASAGVRGSPQLVTVALDVAQVRSAPPTPSPSGMVFIVQQGGAGSLAQVLTVFASSTAPQSFNVQQQTADGGAWLQLDPLARVTSTSAPGRVNVYVTPGNLPVGVYRGDVNATLQGLEGDDVRSVNITMIVTPRPTTAPRAAPPRLEGCARAALVPTHTGLVNNFQTRVAWPTPINVRVFDNCGEPVTDAQGALTFSNGDPPIALVNLADGNYAGTWTPRTAVGDSMSIRATMTAGTITAAVELMGRVAEGAAPILVPNGVTNLFDRRVGGALAPQTLVEINGQNLAGGALAVEPRDGRLPDTVADVTVFAGGARVPLSAVGPDQLRGQLPDSAVNQLVPMVVKSAGRLSTPLRVGIVAAQPGVQATADGAIIAQDAELLPIGPQNRARAGSVIRFHVVGMGATEPAVAAGSVAPATPPALVANAPVVTLGGLPCNVVFAGLEPGLVGVYRIVVEIPAGLAEGDHPLVVRQGSVAGNTVNVPVAAPVE